MFTKIVPDIGKMTTIENSFAHYSDDKTYRHVRVMIGKNKMHLLFTDKDLEKAIYRVQKNRDDIYEQIPPDREVPTSNLYWSAYSIVITAGFLTLLVARFLGV